MTTRFPTLAAAMAVTLISLPAVAGSWPNLPARKAPATPAVTVAQADEPTSLERYRYFPNEEKTHGKRTITYASGNAKPKASASLAGAGTGFEYVGGDVGWEPAQHKFVWSGGTLAHSDECDHIVRSAKAPTPAEIEEARKAYPGA